MILYDTKFLQLKSTPSKSGKDRVYAHRPNAKDVVVILPIINNEKILFGLKNMVDTDTLMNDEQRTTYTDVMKHQYQDLKYKIKDEKIYIMLFGSFQRVFTCWLWERK